MARTADPTQREKILKAAREVFAKKGYTDTRMSDIAEQAGIAVGTIYLYFKTKESMCNAFTDIMNKRILEESLPLLAEGDFATAVGNSLRCSWRIMAEEKDLMSLLYLNIGFMPFENYQPTEIETEIGKVFYAFLQQRMATGECRNCDLAIALQLIYNLLERTAVGCLLMGAGSSKNFEQPMIDFVQHALVNPNYKPKKQKKGVSK